MRPLAGAVSLFLSCHALAAPAETEVSTRIVGGSVVTTPYPWMVALLDAFEDDPFQAQMCGGTLIAPDLVLTAAHCVEEYPPHALQVAVGMIDLDTITSDDRLAVADLIVHSAYDPATLDNDIALLKLASPVVSPPLSLADERLTSTLTDGDPLDIMGWGALNDGAAQRFPKKLQEAQIDFLSRDRCRRYADTTDITPNMLCATVLAGGVDTCQGDSGGPLLLERDETLHQVGIVSWGIGCARPDSPGVYTRVANYIDWIDTARRSLHAPARVDFGYVATGRSEERYFTIRNWSDTGLAIVSIEAHSTSTPSPVTALDHDCSAPLSPLSQCRVKVTLTPQNTDMAGTSLSVTSTDGTTTTVELEARVLAPIDNEPLGEHGTWFSGGERPWRTITGTDGRLALTSGAIGDGEESVLLGVIEGPGVVAFEWRVSSEQDFDLLELSVNGVISKRISGEVQWNTSCLDLEAGEHELLWIYRKDATFRHGDDRGSVDNVRLLPPGQACPRSTTSASTLPPLSDGGGIGASFTPAWLLLLAPFLRRRRNTA